MLLNDLANTLINAGCTVQEVPGWQTRNRGELSGTRSIIIHHTAGAATGDYPSLAVVRDGRPNLPGPLAQLGVGRSGMVYVFSSGKANHAGEVLRTEWSNAYSIGIEVESVGTGPVWAVEQVHETARAVSALCRRHVIPVSQVLGHKEVCSPPGRKVDPVGIPGGMSEFRALVQNYLNGEEDMDQTQDKKLDETWRTLVTGAGYENTALARNLGYIVEEVKAVKARVEELEGVTVQLDYDRFVTDVVDRLAAKLGTLRFDVEPPA